MEIRFSKYHGTGNDFILIDDRSESFDLSNTRLVKAMCSRRFGIGADGLILLRPVEHFDFHMVYFNSDGNQSTMCGNGGRCIVQFAKDLGLINQDCRFLAIDGEHEASIVEFQNIKLKMGSIDNVHRDGNAIVLDTGSPHYVVRRKDVDTIDVKKEGSEIRYSELYKEEGINVNFIEVVGDKLKVATYERGVEDETYSCGTGVTAAALAIQILEPNRLESPISIETKGGELKVFFEQKNANQFTNIWLEGPAVKTFVGDWAG